MCFSKVTRCRGISLLEVLISIGILSIGLLSVLSLLPAGRTYLVKAEVDDRAATIIPNAISTMEALSLFGEDSLDWVSKSNTMDDGERPAERPIFIAKPVLVDWAATTAAATRKQIEDSVNQARWKKTTVDSASIKSWYPQDPQPASLGGTTTKPNSRVRAIVTNLTSNQSKTVYDTSSSTGIWSTSDAFPLAPPPMMEIQETGGTPGEIDDSAPRWIDYRFDVTCEVPNPTPPGGSQWVDTPYTISGTSLKPVPGQSDVYRFYGQRRKTDERTGVATLIASVDPMDRTNDKPGSALQIAPKDLISDDSSIPKKVTLVRRSTMTLSGELWRFDIGSWNSAYTERFTFTNIEPQTVTSSTLSYPSPFWISPSANAPGARGSDQTEEDVDYLTFPVSAGEAFELNWLKSATPLTELADPVSTTARIEPFRVEFLGNSGSWLPLSPFESGNGFSKYTTPTDGTIRMAVGLTPVVAGGPTNTIVYDTKVVPPTFDNRKYALEAALFRADRMVAIDPLMCTHIDRVIESRKGSYGNDPRKHPLANSRLRFGDGQVFYGGDASQPRSFVIPRLNWRLLASITDSNPSMADFNAAVAAAERLCRVEDSVAANPSVDPDAADEPGFDVSPAGVPLRRQAAGRMTWMLTVQPQELGSVESQWKDGRFFTASIVVFQDRRFPDLEATSLDGQYYYEGTWGDTDGLIRVSIPIDPITRQVLDPATRQPTAIESDDIERLFKSGAWVLLGPSALNTGSQIDSKMRLEWIRIQNSQIAMEANKIVVNLLPEKPPEDDVLLRDLSEVPVDGETRYKLNVFAYHGVVAVVQRSVKITSSE